MDSSKIFLKGLVKVKGNVKKYRYICFVFVLIGSLLDVVMAFTIPFSMESFKLGYKGLAITFMFIMVLNQLLSSIYRMFARDVNSKYEMYNGLDSNQNATKILSIVRNKVYITKDCIRKRMTSVEIEQNTKKYIDQTRAFKNRIIDNIIRAASFVSMFIGTIVTTLLTVDNLFVLILVLASCMIVIIYITIRQIKRREIFFKEKRELRDLSQTQKMDLLNVLPISKKHQEFLADSYQSSESEIYSKEIKISFKEQLEGCYKSATMSISIIVLLIVSLLSFKEITMVEFASVLALSTLYSRLLSTLSEEVASIQSLIDAFSERKSYNDIMDIIAKKYLQITSQKANQLESINTMCFKDLCFTHKDVESNVSHKIIAHELRFISGECTLISGESGSGKSTLLKIISGEYENSDNLILLNNDKQVLSICNYLTYDPDSSLGNRSILTEIMFENDLSTVQKDKIIAILKGLLLYDTILEKSQNEPILEYLSNVFRENFSEGQAVRFMLARLLYNLDDKTEILLFDEPIANLDAVTGSHVMKFLKEYCNLDRNRIIILTSHQINVVKEFCEKEYSFKNFGEKCFKTQIS